MLRSYIGPDNMAGGGVTNILSQIKLEASYTSACLYKDWVFVDQLHVDVQVSTYLPFSLLSPGGGLHSLAGPEGLC